MTLSSDEIASRLNDYIRREEAYYWLEDFDDLNDAEKALIGIWEIQNEVQNGGFLQYFQNFSGGRAPVIAQILRDVGASEAAAVVARAATLAGYAPSWSDESVRFSAIENLSTDIKTQLSQLDAAFGDEAATISERLFAYLFAHRHQLQMPDTFWREVTKQ